LLLLLLLLLLGLPQALPLCCRRPEVAGQLQQCVTVQSALIAALVQVADNVLSAQQQQHRCG
jgi:hypothetical protein